MVIGPESGAAFAVVSMSPKKLAIRALPYRRVLAVLAHLRS